MKPATPKPRPMLESAFKDGVIKLAMAHGWLVMHSRPARTAKGWRTALQGHPGFPDLVLVHEKTGVVLFRELKRDTTKTNPEQDRWGVAIMRPEAACEHLVWLRYAVWRPAGLDHIRFVLANPRGPFRVVVEE